MTSSLLLLACIARAPKVSPEVLAMAGAPADAEASLAASRETFVAVCSDCHLVPAARWHSADEWPHVLDEMRTEHDAEFDDAQKQQNLAYLDLVVAWDTNVRAARKAK
jgi:cytochrome c553